MTINNIFHRIDEMRIKNGKILFCILSFFIFQNIGADDTTWIYDAQIGAGFKDRYGKYMNVENIWYYTNFFYKNLYGESEKEKFVRKVENARKSRRRVITYAGPLEVITGHADKDGNGKIDKNIKTFSMKHPDYLQVGISGRNASLWGSVVGKDSFWVAKDAEDAWLTPNNPDFLRKSIDHILELASLGVDGIWLDIPHMNSQWVEDVWEDEYPSYDECSIQLFEKKYGYPPPKKVDWKNKKWRNRLDFRYQSITNFISKINNALHKQYPNCKLIIEHWMGVGADACDVRGHEVDCATYSRKSQKYYNLLRNMALFRAC